jgi:hypothetical protein
MFLYSWSKKRRENVELIKYFYYILLKFLFLFSAKIFLVIKIDKKFA